jgi:hypothetical protein
MRFAFLLFFMRFAFLLFCSLVVLVPLAGCVTKAKAEAQAHAAYVAGQRQAMQMMQQHGPSITVLGQVRQSIIPWTPEMTLAKLLVAAEYQGTTDPTLIIVVRNGQPKQVNPKELLNGQDMPMEAGDIVQIQN